MVRPKKFIFDEEKWLNIASERLARWEEVSDDECSFITVAKGVSLDSFNKFMDKYEGHIKLIYEDGEVGFWKLPGNIHGGVSSVVYKYLFMPALEESFEKPTFLSPDVGKSFACKYGYPCDQPYRSLTLEVKINGGRRCPDWGLYLRGLPLTHPYIIIEVAYANQSLPHLIEQLVEYVSAPCDIMAAIGIKVFKLRKDGIRRVVVGSHTCTYDFDIAPMWIY